MSDTTKTWLIVGGVLGGVVLLVVIAFVAIFVFAFGSVFVGGMSGPYESEPVRVTVSLALADRN